MKNVLRRADEEVHGRRHAGQQQSVVVPDIDHYRVVHDILLHRGLESNLANASVEGIIRICLHGEAYSLVFLDLPDVAFVDGSEYLHSGEIVGDEKQLGC